MTLNELVRYVKQKENFITIDDYAKFCLQYLGFISNGLQAVIVSQNENNYNFFQYKEDGYYSITRPINSLLMLSVQEFEEAYKVFRASLPCMRELQSECKTRDIINKFVYTCQQSIGATLDALPANESNTARKINGDLFGRFIRLILTDMGIEVSEGTVRVPVEVDGEEQFFMNYQHDVIIKKENELKAIGSVKTSSKDRIDKIFIDKFLYNHLTNSNIPHFAVFLNDVQRSGKEPRYGVNTTFLTGHYKGYTVKLNH